MTSFFKFLRSKRFLFGALGALIFFILFSAGINVYILNASEGFIYKNVDDVPSKKVALVLGAKVYADGRMSDIVKDRALTVIDLYSSGKVEKVLVSGDHGTKTYDEVNTIKDYLLQNGVPAADIFLDHAGFDTYDSVYRARAIFQVPSMIIVTQDFHLPRAVYEARALGMDTVGFSADRHEYLSAAFNEFRESLARVKAFFDVTFQSKPKFLGEVIPIDGDSTLSWDKF